MRFKICLCVVLLGMAAWAQQQDPWPPNTMLAPSALAAQVEKGAAPAVVFVGFPILYKGAHIPKAIFAGPCSRQEGLDLLKLSMKDRPRDAEVVIYCGCCPLVHCPNVRPAYGALKGMGFTNVKILQLDTNLYTDWVQKGYPTVK